MAKTVLEVVQNALTAINDDAVSSIYDSPESEDMAALAKEVFEDVSVWDEWPDEFAMVSLYPVSDDAAPTVFKIDNDFRFIENVQYLVEEHGRRYFKDIDYLIPLEFIDRSDQMMNEDKAQKSTGYGIKGTHVYVGTEHEPSFFTSFDNRHIIFDSYNSSVERNVQQHKCRVYACRVPEFKIEDNFVLDYPQEYMSLYMAELRVAATYFFNQQDNPRDRKLSLRMLNKLRAHRGRTVNEQKENWPNGQYARFPSNVNISKYGRR